MYTPYEGNVSIVDVDGLLYVNGYAAKHGNRFRVPEQTSELVAAVVATAKARKAKINCNTTQTLGKAATNVHSVAQFVKLAETYDPVVAGYGSWRMYLAFAPDADTKAPQAKRAVKLDPNAIVIK